MIKKRSVFRRFEFGEGIPLHLSDLEYANFQDLLQKMAVGSHWQEASQVKRWNPRSFFYWEKPYAYPRNYVGYLAQEDWEIEVYPKIFRENPPSSEVIWQHLLYYYEYAFQQRVAWSFQDQGVQEGESFYEMFLYHYLQSIEQWEKSRPYKTFDRRGASQSFARGKVKFSQYADKNLARGKWQEIYTESPYLQGDNALRQLAKFCIERQENRATGRLKDFLLDLKASFRKVHSRSFSQQEAQNIRLAPSEWKAQNIKDMSIFLLAGDFGLKGDKKTGLAWSFLIPMENLFERFIYGFIRHHFPKVSLEWQSQSYLAERAKNEESAIRIQADLFFSESQHIVDTKYKLLRGRPEGTSSSGISNEDVYQILSYGLARDCRELSLLYPQSFHPESREVQAQVLKVKSDLIPDSSMQIQIAELSITRGREENWKEKLDQQIKKQLRSIFPFLKP